MKTAFKGTPIMIWSLHTVVIPSHISRHDGWSDSLQFCLDDFSGNFNAELSKRKAHGLPWGRKGTWSLQGRRVPFCAEEAIIVPRYKGSSPFFAEFYGTALAFVICMKPTRWSLRDSENCSQRYPSTRIERSLRIRACADEKIHKTTWPCAVYVVSTFTWSPKMCN